VVTGFVWVQLSGGGGDDGNVWLQLSGGGDAGCVWVQLSAGGGSDGVCGAAYMN